MDEEGQWLPLIAAARVLGTSENALRKRITRGGEIRHEKRAGLIYVWVAKPNFTIVSPAANQALTIPATDATNQRLAQAIEEHNRLLRMLLELDNDPPPQTKKRRWPWQRHPTSF